MPSSTFASETRFARSATAAFVCVLLALLAPYEALVRAAEHRWGMLPARITPRRTGAPHIEMFLEDRAAGIVYPVVAVGTSRVENGVRPDAINALIGPTYNLGIGGGSSIVTLEFLESLNIVPRHLIVGLSPMDFTPLALVRGRKVIARRHVEQPGETELPPTRWLRERTHALVHASTPDRRRNLENWLELQREHGEVLAFLNNEGATGKLDLRQTYGYLPIAQVVDPQTFAQGESSNIPGEYERGRLDGLPRRLIELVRRFRSRGTNVVFMRVPTTAALRRSEDFETSFARDVLVLAHACDVPYVDGETLMGATFLSTRSNFADSEHLNDSGAAQFSLALAGKIRALSSPSLPSGAAPSPEMMRSVHSSTSPPVPESPRR